MRTLPLRLSPIEGESLPGYVARYSHTFQFPPGDVIRALGLGSDGTVVSAGRYGVSLPLSQLKHVAFATGMTVEVLGRMLLSRYTGRAFEQTAISADAALDEAAQGHEILIRSSRFCPQCLHEHGAWMLRWQLGWTAICPRHGALLVRVCPKCGTVPKAALRERWLHDRHHGPLSDPTRCARRLGRNLCRARLATADTPSVSDEAVAAQLRIDTLLDGGAPTTLAGTQLEPHVYLRCLHVLCKLLAYHTRLPSQAGPPSPRAGRRLLDDPATIATVLPGALRLADLPDQAAFADAVRELANRRYHRDGQTLPLSKLGEVPDPLRVALRHALSETAWAPALSQMGLHPRAHRRPDDLDHHLGARHVPQLFWAEDYQREISALFDFDDFTHWLGRRFCSLLLARMLTPLDWHAAVRYLDFPETFINDGYHTTLGKLRANDRFDELAHRVKRIANQRAQQELIDYKQRRAQLADWTGISVETWPLLQPRPRPHRWRVDNPSRRARSSVWLWCQLTRGHERAAPIALPTNNLAHQGEFIREALPDLRERLLVLGELLLATPADARQTLPTQLAAALHQRGHLAENFHLDTPPLAGSRHRTQARMRRARPRSANPPCVDQLIADRVLAHVSAHTGVDIPSLTRPSQGSHAPPAVTHARLLAAGLLRRVALASRAAIAATIGGTANHLSENERRYHAALERNPRLAAEFDRLAHAVEDWHAPTPTHPTAPHPERMRGIAMAIKTHSAEFLGPSHGADVARRTSITLCRQHTDLTCYDIAAIHDVKAAQPTYSRATVERYRRHDPGFENRYRQLLAHARELRQQAGYTNANLHRGLTRNPGDTRPNTPATGNHTSHWKVA